MRTRTIQAVIVTLFSLVVAGCDDDCGCNDGGGSTGRIQDRYAQLEHLTEQRDMAVMDMYDPNYLDSGYTYLNVQDDFVQFFRDFRNIDEHFDIQNINISGDLAYVTFDEWFEAQGAYDGVWYVSDRQTYAAVWKYEYGDWFLYGNQRSSAALKSGTLLHFKRERRPVSKE